MARARARARTARQSTTTPAVGTKTLTGVDARFAVLLVLCYWPAVFALESGESYPCGSTEEEASFPIREYLQDSPYSPSWNTTVVLVSPPPPLAPLIWTNDLFAF